MHQLIASGAAALMIALGTYACGDTCASTSECAAGSICYQGGCEIWEMQTLACNAHDECGGPMSCSVSGFCLQPLGQTNVCVAQEEGDCTPRP